MIFIKWHCYRQAEGKRPFTVTSCQSLRLVHAKPKDNDCEHLQDFGSPGAHPGADAAGDAGLWGSKDTIAMTCYSVWPVDGAGGGLVLKGRIWLISNNKISSLQKSNFRKEDITFTL